MSDAVAWGLMLGYGMPVIRETGRGRQAAPSWPEVEGWGDLMRPAILVDNRASMIGTSTAPSTSIWLKEP